MITRIRVEELVKEFDECTNKKEIFAEIQYWFYEKMVIDFGGEILLASKPIAA